MREQRCKQLIAMTGVSVMEVSFSDCPGLWNFLVKSRTLGRASPAGGLWVLPDGAAVHANQLSKSLCMHATVALLSRPLFNTPQRLTKALAEVWWFEFLGLGC